MRFITKNGCGYYSGLLVARGLAPHSSLGRAPVVTLFEGLAFVVALFALTDREPQFDKPALGEDFEWDDGAALGLGFEQRVYFAAFGEQFASAGLVWLSDGYAAGAMHGAA